MRRRKILHIITGLEIGGAETNLLKIIPSLEQKFENEVCCLMNKGGLSESFSKKNINVTYLGIKNLFGFFNPIIIFRFGKIVKRFKPDIIETYLIHSDLFGRIWGRFFLVKKIVCNHRGSLLQWEWMSFFDKVTSFLVTKYVFQTKVAQKEISKKINISLKKSVVIPNAIELDVFNFNLEKEKKLEELKIGNKNNLNIVTVSNLRKGKGHAYLIEAFEEIFKQKKNVNLIIVGDGDQLTVLKKQAENLRSKENIYFLGKRTDVFEILKISDIFVLPTHYEGMSNAIMEAMASGMSIITTDIEVNKELVTNEYSALLVPIKNSQEIGKNILRLCNDASLRKTLGANAQREIKEKYSIEIISKKIIEVLNEI